MYVCRCELQYADWKTPVLRAVGKARVAPDRGDRHRSSYLEDQMQVISSHHMDISSRKRQKAQHGGSGGLIAETAWQVLCCLAEGPNLVTLGSERCSSAENSDHVMSMAHSYCD